MPTLDSPFRDLVESLLEQADLLGDFFIDLCRQMRIGRRFGEDFLQESEELGLGDSFRFHAWFGTGVWAGWRCRSSLPKAQSVYRAALAIPPAAPGWPEGSL